MSISSTSQPGGRSVHFDETLDDAYEIQKSMRGHMRRKERKEKKVGKGKHNMENDDTFSSARRKTMQHKHTIVAGFCVL
jgi:hypothetical protein